MNTIRLAHPRLSLLINIIRWTLVTAVVMVILVCAVALDAANAWREPYGGCDEAYLYPHSRGAEQCRNHGWVISRRLVVTDRAIVSYSTLPHCEYEDGSYSHLPTPHRCTWNIGPGRDGDGRGIAYWFGWQWRGQDRVAHYVWRDDPTSTGRWGWVNHRLASALSEGSGEHADTRPWERCVTRLTGGDHRLVRCPNGNKMEVS